MWYIIDADTVADAEIVSCEHFKVRRVNVDGSQVLTFDPASFTVVMCVEGEVVLTEDMVLRSGRTVLVLACLHDIEIKGCAKLLIARL